MKYTEFPPPYDFQPRAAALTLDRLHNPGPKKTAGFVSPTGSGKSTVEALCLEAEPRLHVVAPVPLIAAGIYEALTGTPKLEARQEQWEAARIFTEKRYLNLLAKAEVMPPRFLIDDEGHHSVADTHGGVWDLCGRCPRALVTATHYRGTPDSTEELRVSADTWEHWIRLDEAVATGVVTLPEFVTVPLFDDELIDIVNGEFASKATDSLVRSRLDALLEFLGGFYNGAWADRCTLVLPGTSSVNLLMDAMTARGLPAVEIVSGTSDAARRDAFEKTMAKTHALLQIRAVGEGVDFPIRIMWDAAPTVSPMLCMQRWGRTFRPGGKSVVYSLCHNYLRHAYLLEGLATTGSIKQAREVWGKEWKPTRRLMTRALGSMGFGKFKPVEVPTITGAPVFLYSLKSAEDSFACLMLPAQPEPVFFMRSDTPTGEIGTARFSGREVQYAKRSRGKWKHVGRLPNVANAASLPPERVTDKTLFDWATHAAKHGLDSKHIPDAKQASLFYILRDTGLAVG